MNLGVLRRSVAVILLLMTASILVYAHWTEITLLLEESLEESLEMLRQIQIRYFVLAFSVYLLSVYFFAIRWQKVLSSIGYDLKAADLFPIFFGAIFVNNFTPASRFGGEPLRIIWANRRFGIIHTHALITIVFERLVEAVPIALLFLYSLYFFPLTRNIFQSHRGMLSWSTALFLLLFLLGAGTGTWLFRKKLEPFLNRLHQNWEQLRKSFVPVLLLSCGVWALDIVRLEMVASALKLPIPLHIIATVSILYLVLGCLPITPGGLGIVEGGLVYLLLYFGLPLASAGSFVFLERFISYGLSSMIGFLYLSYYGGVTAWKNTKSR
ncbi:lysylphosphatidylglycerol synthase transmembrane domain-containing protein [Methanosarcina siciliae]|uniref:lysylphosphatidylglycerol synthase transmembrane domain-containing protein n=1 Tax=Methanosarcina siciliae TaxID=38027 RepID=UPI000ACD61B3|nr:YbhN family protein [Methanosarcina siciliae]